MKNKSCTSLQKPSSFWRSLRLFCTGLILLPVALMILAIRKSLLLIQLLFLRRPMIKKPIYLTKLEPMEEDNQKKTDELGPHLRNLIDSLDDPMSLQNARWILEYNFHYQNEQNNAQNNLTKFPAVDYDDAIQ